MRALGRLLALLFAARAALRALRRPGRVVVSPDGEPTAGEDPRSRTLPGSRRAETATAALLGLAALCGFGFTALYVISPFDTQLLGLALGLALILLAAAAILAGKGVVPQETSVQPRDPLLEEGPTAEVAEILHAGGEGISRRGLLTATGGLAGAAVVTAAATPVASLGPNLSGIHETPWRRGVRLVDDAGRPLRADEIQIGTFYTALPEGGDRESLGAGLLVVKLAPDQIHLPPDRQGWAPQGILAYSKICPHAGCAVSLYRYPLYTPTSGGQKPAFTCPCHYSTFLAGEGGKLVFGPAGRALPQLPLTIDAAGELRAGGAFREDVGPSWWNVHRGSA